MPVVISGIRTRLDESEEAAVEKALHKAGMTANQVTQAFVVKRSVDARKQREISWVSSVQFTIHGNEEKLAARLANKFGDNRIKLWKEKPLAFEFGVKKLEHPVAIAGFGPAGIFAALVLAEQGYRPLVFERGPAIEKRIAAVQEFWNGGVFEAKSNVQFGEGGAGTFSDGKLTTRISDNRCAYVLKRFAEFGAPPEIMKKAKPHIGTDLLRGVVRNMRERILACGGKILFDTQVTGLVLKNQQVVSVTTNQGDFSVGGLILAIGHSARDTFQMLAAQKPSHFRSVFG